MTYPGSAASVHAGTDALRHDPPPDEAAPYGPCLSRVIFV